MMQMIKTSWKLSVDSYTTIAKNYKISPPIFGTSVSRGFEVACIGPTFWNLMTIQGMYKMFKPLTIGYPKNVGAFVSFTRVPFDPAVKISCDWCSLCNGILEYIKQSITMELENAEYIDEFFKSTMVSLFLLTYVAFIPFWIPYLLGISPHTKDEWIDTDTLFKTKDQILPRSTSNGLYMVASMYNLIQGYEPRWCAYRHMKDIFVSHPKYQHFIDCKNYDMLYRSGKVLSTYGKIDCHRCSDLLNTDPLVDDYTNVPSPFSEFTSFETYFELIKES